MKTTLGALALLICTSLLGQESQLGFLKVEATFGIFSSNETMIADLEDGYYEYYISVGPEYTARENSTVTYNLDVNFFRYRKIEVSLNLGYHHMFTDQAFVEYDPNLPNAYRTEDATIDVISFMPEVRMNWITSSDKIFQMYSALSFGLNFITEEHSSQTQFNEKYKLPGGQLTGLGIRFGDKFGGFMEVGVGSRGIMTAGLSYRFE